MRLNGGTYDRLFVLCEETILEEGEADEDSTD